MTNDLSELAQMEVPVMCAGCQSCEFKANHPIGIQPQFPWARVTSCPLWVGFNDNIVCVHSPWPCPGWRVAELSEVDLEDVMITGKLNVECIGGVISLRWEAGNKSINWVAGNTPKEAAIAALLAAVKVVQDA